MTVYFSAAWFTSWRHSNAMWTFLGFLLVISQSYAYNLKISPKIHTQVTNLQNRGDNNSIQFSAITNSTILQATTQQVFDTHFNELLSTSIFLSVFGVVFLILAITINKLTLTIYKLSLRVTILESKYSV